MSGRVVLASGNAGKLRELEKLLQPLGLAVVSQAAMGIEPVDETGSTFADNALLKARHAARCSALPAIADDSGLEVDQLGGEPGVYSARYAGVDASDDANVDKLLAELVGVEDVARTARFKCVVVYVREPEDPAPLICYGCWEGRILSERRGNGGFGYDPVFYLPTLGCSAAELSLASKNTRSHRAIAMRQLIEKLRGHAC